MFVFDDSARFILHLIQFVPRSSMMIFECLANAGMDLKMTSALNGSD